MSRAVDPVELQLTDEQKAKHEKSVKSYPTLNLSEAEYIISVVDRHPIGLMGPVGVTAVLLAIIISVMFNFDAFTSGLGLDGGPGVAVVLLVGTLLSALVAIGGYVAIWVYMSNRFYLTNESVIQEIQESIFSKREQTVSLANIEDASYRQRGFVQALFNYGSIRLSTEGDETTYRFYYVSQPKRQIAILNNAVEAFKNGRPIDS